MFTATPNGRVRRLEPDGVALSVLCEKCNNNYGSRLGTGFSEFVSKIAGSATIETPVGDVLVRVPEIYPARIIRQLLLSFLCAQPSENRPGWDGIRDFIRSRDLPLPNDAPRVSLYYNSSDSYRIVPICGVGAIDGTQRQWAGSEIAAPGLGIVFTISDGGAADAARLIGKLPVDVSGWADVAFDRKVTTTMALPRLRVEQPHPLGFGRPKDFERWQVGNSVMWSVADAEFPDAITAVAVVWRAENRRGPRRRSR